MTRLAIGDRVQFHPATDQWMSGERYGEVKGFTRLHNVRVLGDRSGRIRVMHPSNVIPLRDIQLREAVRRGLNACSTYCLDNDAEVELTLAAVMAELELVGIRDTMRPPASAEPSSASDTERPPPCR